MMVRKGFCCRGEENYIVTRLNDAIEASIKRRVKKYECDLRVIATYLLKGYEGVGDVLIFRELQERHPEEHRELKEITRKALLVAEEPEDYLPEGYVSDRSNPDLLVLKRDNEDKTFVAAFSASGVSFQGILDATRWDGERRGEI